MFLNFSWSLPSIRHYRSTYRQICALGQSISFTAPSSVSCLGETHIARSHPLASFRSFWTMVIDSRSSEQLWEAQASDVCWYESNSWSFTSQFTGFHHRESASACPLRYCLDCWPLCHWKDSPSTCVAYESDLLASSQFSDQLNHISWWSYWCSSW